MWVPQPPLSLYNAHPDVILKLGPKEMLFPTRRIEGHVRSIRDMADNGRDCQDLLLRIAAVRKALDGVAKVILKDHLENVSWRQGVNRTKSKC